MTATAPAKQLRDYQSAGLAAIAEARARGINRQLLSAATGAGKTEVFSFLIKDEIAADRTTLVLAHRDRLVTQAAARIEGIVGRGHIGFVNGTKKDWWKRCVVATVQSAASEKQLERAPKFDTIIVDECFPAGTLIDGKPVEQLKIGDLVTCYDHLASKIVHRKILNLTCKKTTQLAIISLNDGSSITCTPNHPIYVKELNQYVPAISIRPGHAVTKTAKTIHKAQDLCDLRNRLSTQELEPQNDSDVFISMQVYCNGATQKENYPQLQMVQYADRMQGEKGIESGAKGCRVLLRGLQEKIYQPQREPASIGLQQKARICPNEGEQPNQAARSFGQDVSQAQGANFSLAWREWPANRTPEGFSRRDWMANGSGNCDSSGKGNISVPPASLQGRRGERRIEDGNRSGRELAQNEEVEISGQAENRNLECVRVDSVEILERGCDERFDQLCPDGHVYNFEVEEYHNYFANGVLVHNCHRSRAPQYAKVIDKLLRPGGLLLGVTATPNRTDKKGLIPEVYQEVVYEIGMQELIDRGFLCPVIGKEIKLPIDFSKIHTATSTDGIRDYKPKEIQEAFEEAKWLERITIGWLQLDRECPELGIRQRRMIVFVPPGIVDGRGCGMAHSLAEYMRLQDINAAAVDGTTNKGEQDRIIADFTAGRIQVLVNVNIFTEGLDIPPIDCVLFARPTQSSIIYSQAIGRGSRIFEGKENLLVIDVTGITEQLQSNGQSLMTLGRVLPTEEQRVSLRAERMKFAKALMRKLWRKAVTLKLGEDRKIQVFGEIGAKEKKELEEYADEITEILQKRDAGEEEGSGAGSKPVNNTLLTGKDRIEVRDIDFGQAGIAFNWQTFPSARQAVLSFGNDQYRIHRPELEGEYVCIINNAEQFPYFATWHEAKAAIEHQAAKAELKKRSIFSDPNAAWRRTPASEGQIKKLQQFKIPVREGITKGDASDLLQPIFDKFKGKAG